MLKGRPAYILEAAVREYIENGGPVSSAHLYERYDFGIKPAMIRFELNELVDLGFLEQPHHSAGRIPSDKGFEFFARKSLEDAQERTIPAGQAQDLFLSQAWDDLLEELSAKLGVLGVIKESREQEVHKEGLEELIDHLEWESRQQIKQVIHDFEQIDERVSATTRRREVEDLLEVFIGRKSPITKSEQLAVMASDYRLGEGRVFIFLVGPKRMDYRRGASILQAFKQCLDTHDAVEEK